MHGLTVNALGAGKTAAISAVIAGSQVLTKFGTGPLSLNGAVPYSFTGGLTVTQPFHTGPMLPPGTNSAGNWIVLRSGLLRRTAAIHRTTRRTMGALSQAMWATGG